MVVPFLPTAEGCQMSSDSYDGPFSRERLKQFGKSQGASLGQGRPEGLPSGVGAATQPLGSGGFSLQRMKEFATGRNLEGQQNGWKIGRAHV